MSPKDRVKIKNLDHPKTMLRLVNLLINQKVKDSINVIQEMEVLIENPERVGEKAEIGVTEIETETGVIVASGQAIVKRVSKRTIETIDQTIGAKEMIEVVVTSDQTIVEKAFKEMTETIDQRVDVLATQIGEIKDLKSHSVMVLP